MRVKVIVSGALGRMGREVAETIKISPDMELVGGIEAEEKLSENPGFPLFSKPSETKADVLADFTRPDVSLAILEDAARAGMGLVVGTTGFSEGQSEQIKCLTETVPVVLSANMSLGINLLIGILPRVAERLLEYDIEITETHHRHKLDAPSGTAGTILNAIRQARPDLMPIKERGGQRKPDEVGIFSLRGGEVFGEHTVLFMGEGEVMEMTHRALSRKCFAHGALAAIRFITGAKPGLYTMKEVLGL